ncbi:aldehyde ferredoxin oxidoreductase family protein [Chloroflexota bacterium]
MMNGNMGKVLFVNLSNGEIKEELLDESLYRDYIGGYGIGARILYDRQKPGVDPLGPDNTFGILTGPLTGTNVPMGTRYTSVARSPVTGGWGDANAGGNFGPHLKMAGYDAVFFSGISSKPVCLLVDNGKAELVDAGNLWGKNTYEVEELLESKYGKDIGVVTIGISGEKLSLFSCTVSDRGAVAARSGLGAVMGSKKLKALVAKGDRKVPMAEEKKVNELRNAYIASMKVPGPDGKSMYDVWHKYGTSSMTARSAHSGDSPVKNWKGIGVIDLPDIEELRMEASVRNMERYAGCWHCPLGCESRLKAGEGEYKYPAGIRRPEYETEASFGALVLNNNREAINMANHICNDYGIDTISAGSVVAFAMECYENGIITKEDCGGLDLTWGNHRAIIALTEMIAKREGIGDILADGVKIAAEKIGKGAEEYAIHIGGQELGMHDPKLAMRGDRPSAARYWIEPTPGRHMQSVGPSSFQGHMINASGLCLLGNRGNIPNYFLDILNAVTGFGYSLEEMLMTGERILTMRHLFNLREGINPLDWEVHPRIVGDPPQKEGPLAGIRADIEAQAHWNLGAMDWDRKTTKPSKAKLLKLGMVKEAEELWSQI